MDSLRDALIDSFKAGTFIQVVYARSMAERGQNTTLAAELAALHNAGAIDVIAGFTSLKNKPGSGVNFFLTRHVFEKALPQITASIQSVIACVHHLYTEAGRDGAAGMILDAYISFCEKEPSRPKEALKEIERNPDLLTLLIPTIVAGSRIDTSHTLPRPFDWLATLALKFDEAQYSRWEEYNGRKDQRRPRPPTPLSKKWWQTKMTMTSLGALSRHPSVYCKVTNLKNIALTNC